MLVFLQVSFIVFLFFHFYLDLERIGVTKELFWPTTAMASFFFYKKKEALKSYKELIFYIASIYLILYSSINGMIYLPESFVIKQKMYLKFLYYTSFFSFLFLVHKQKTKRILFVFTLLSSTHIFLSWYYLINSTRSIPLLLYSFLFVSCFELPKKFKLRPLHILAFLIFVSSILSTVFSANFARSLPSFLYLVSGLVIFYILSLFQNIKEKRLIMGFIFLYYSLSILIFLAYLFQSNTLFLFQRTFETSIGSFQVNSIGSMIAINFPLVLFFTLFQKPYKFVYGFILMISLVVLYFTHSRASILAIGISSVFILLHFLKNTRIIHQNKKAFFLILLTFFAFGIFVFLNAKKSSMFTDVSTLEVRFGIWEYFYRITSREAPFLGFGPENESILSTYPTKDLSPKVLKIIQDYVQYSGANPHAHNLIFQLFNNYGFLGVLSYSLLSLYLSILLIKSFLKKKVSVFILIPLSALLSVFMQELFDYTIPDSIIFYLVIVLLGILAASYRSKIIYTVTLSLNPYVRKITLTGLFIFMFTSFLLSYNYQLADQIENLFYKEIQHDNFHNFRFRVPLAASPNVKKFIQLDKKYLPLRVDEKRELFTGEIYLELSREGLPFLKKAEDRFLRCVKLNPRSAFCYRELSEIARMNKEEEKAGQLLDKYKALDPLHLIK